MTLHRYRSFIQAATLTLVCWVAPGVASADDSDAKIEIKNYMFAPTTVTIKAGSKVTWTNFDDEPHNIVSDSGLFRSSAMDTSETFSYKFDKPGTYRFVCSIHPRMVGTIVVQ
jgi:plastocyanin